MVTWSAAVVESLPHHPVGQPPQANPTQEFDDMHQPLRDPMFASYTAPTEMTDEMQAGQPMPLQNPSLPEEARTVMPARTALSAAGVIAGRADALNRSLVNVDLWSGRITNTNVQSALEKGNCPCCKQQRFDYLDGRAGSSTTTLCGRNAIQISAPVEAKMDFSAIAKKLRTVSHGDVMVNEFLVRCRVGEHDITVFADGRAIIQGTNDPNTARIIYAKYIGA